MKNAWMKSALRWINLHPFWRSGRTSVWGNGLRAPTFDRWLALQLHRAGIMGAADRRFLQMVVKPGMTVVDIGANQGLYTLFFSDLVGEGGRVLAFEPDDMLYEALRENIASNQARNVQPYHLAVGSKCDTMNLYRSLLNSGDNRLASESPKDLLREAINVQIERLDVILAGEQIDFIKIDVQGWEMEAFRGMQALLDSPANANISIYFEYSPQGLIDAGSEPTAPLTFLKENGFEIQSFREGRSAAPVDDLGTFAASMPTGAYVNLHALRRA